MFVHTILVSLEVMPVDICFLYWHPHKEIKMHVINKYTKTEYGYISVCVLAHTFQTEQKSCHQHHANKNNATNWLA